MSAPGPPGGPARLIGVSIRCGDTQRPAATFAALLGGEPQPLAVPPGAAPTLAFTVGEATVTIIAESASARAGIETIHLGVPNPEARVAQLEHHGATVERAPGLLRIPSASANGVAVELSSANALPVPEPPSAVAFDHVALLVHDLPAAVDRWSAIVGAAPAMVGAHPLGGSDAARFLLGPRMVELLSPWPGVDSPMRTRLETAGEGPLALALVARDLDASIHRCEAAGATLLRQPPHVFIHPRDTGGVLVQLTPRLHH